jgi:hypothetical protein
VDILEIAESYINGNFTDTKNKVKRMSKYEFLQFVFRLQDLGINDEQIEKLVN